jgi:chromosome segregation ATPase
MFGPLLRKCAGWAAYLLAITAAVALGFAIPRASSTSPPQPTGAEIMHRLSVMQQELSFKADVIDDALQRLAERSAQKMDESNAGKAAPDPQLGQLETSKRRLDELERQFDRLSRYVKDVEKSIAKIDTNLSTPGVLEKVVEHQKAVARP